jgi:hypothetical protein
MTTLQRYDIDMDVEDGYDPWYATFPCESGEWVKYEEAAAELSRIEDKYVNLCPVLNEQAGEIERLDTLHHETALSLDTMTAERDRLTANNDVLCRVELELRLAIGQLIGLQSAELPQGLKALLYSYDLWPFVDTKLEYLPYDCREGCARPTFEAADALDRISQARLTWAMACQCTCDACESFSSVIRKACFQSEASPQQPNIPECVEDVPR